MKRGDNDEMADVPTSTITILRSTYITGIDLVKNISTKSSNTIKSPPQCKLVIQLNTVTNPTTNSKESHQMPSNHTI